VLLTGAFLAFVLEDLPQATLGAIAVVAVSGFFALRCAGLGGRVGSRRALRLLVLHDDAEREFDYTTGAETALDQAKSDGWTVVSIKSDWARVFSK
jgi:hypothetical protein